MGIAASYPGDDGIASDPAVVHADDYVYSDSFGNLVTDIAAAQLADVPTDPERVRIRCDEHETQGLFKTYGEQPPMTLLALVGSSGYLELAIVDENASMMLGIRTGTPVTVDWT